MTVPTMTTIAKGGTSANSTSLILTLTEGTAIEQLVGVFIVCSVSPTVSDSLGNSWTTANTAAGGYVSWCLPGVPFQAGDTITITVSSSTLAAMAFKFAPHPVVTGLTVDSTAKQGPSSLSNAATGTNASAVSGTSFTPQTMADCLGLFTVFVGGATETAFSSVSGGYAIADSQGTTGTGTQRGIAVCTKSITSANPMLAQSPTMTLSSSFSWGVAHCIMRGQTEYTGGDLLDFAMPATLVRASGLGGDQRVGSVKKINGLTAIKTQNGLV